MYVFIIIFNIFTSLYFTLNFYFFFFLLHLLLETYLKDGLDSRPLTSPNAWSYKITVCTTIHSMEVVFAVLLFSTDGCGQVLPDGREVTREAGQLAMFSCFFFWIGVCGSKGVEQAPADQIDGLQCPGPLIQSMGMVPKQKLSYFFFF